MSPRSSPPPPDANEQVAALIGSLHEIERRIEALTGGEVDTVSDRDGRTILLQRAQEALRHRDAERQAAILNALPAHVALLDPDGLIISVNDGWREFAAENSLQSEDYGLGVNYLDVCDAARGPYSEEAPAVAKGIRSVLYEGTQSFSIEYPCHSPTQQRWFLLLVTPLADRIPNGAVVMHVNVTAERRAETGLRVSEERFRQMAENINEVFWLSDPANKSILYVSPAYENIWGRSCESLYASPRDWIDAIHPNDRERVTRAAQEKQALGTHIEEYRIIRPDGGVRWIRDRSFPVAAEDGLVYRITGLAEDITERRRAAEVLYESERRFGDLFRNIQLLSLMLDREGRITYCNDYLLRLTGWRNDEVIGRSWFELFVPPEETTVRQEFSDLLANRPEAWHQENQILTRSGERRLIRWNNSVLRSGLGQVLGSASIGEDITEQKRAGLKIARLNRVYAVLSQINALIVRVHDREELFKEACRIAVEAGAFKMAWIAVADPDTLEGNVVTSYGIGADYFERVTLTTRDGLAESDRPASLALRTSQPVIRNDISTDASLAPFRDGMLGLGVKAVGCFPLTTTGTPDAVIVLCAGETNAFDDEETRLLLELSHDISFALDHIQKEAQLNYLAYYDVLTGLANRSLFLERVSQFMRSAAAGGHRLALFLVDIERFKNINDSLGRQAGDALLRQIAEWLTRNVGGANLLARIGADHFAVVLPEIDELGSVARLIEKMMGAFQAHPFRLLDAVLLVPAKVGAAIFPDDGSDADTLFKNTEAALKKAKGSGDRYLFYTQNMTAAVAAKLTLENQLRRALDNEEFVLHYQPKVNLRTAALTGVEALIRWNDPQTGRLVPPGEFIPVLEETGLIFDAGRWALRTAIADYLRWRAAGLSGIRVAVNVSPLQLRNRQFLGELEQITGINEHAAAGLELEITESMIMEDVKHSIATLDAIRAMNVCVAIDDFGTGFSSLSYLARLPVDTLKIDRSFVTDMTAGPQGLALVSTIISLAHSLKLNVVAEGVETDEQSRLLSLLGCDEMQGFLYDRPMPSEAFEEKYVNGIAR